MTTISENTNVKLPLVLGLLGAAAVAVGWSATVNARLDNTEKKCAVVDRIDRRLSRIEGALKVKIPDEDRLLQQ